MAFPTCTVLIVENFLPDRELYRRSLLSDKSCDYRLLEVETVKAGLELCRTEAIDAILLDYLLPDGDGLEFLHALHVQSDGETPPVVIVTGQGNESIAVQAIKQGAEDYLVKRRLTPDLLRLTMRSAIENARLRLQLQHSDDRFRVSIENMLDCFGIFLAVRDGTGQIVDFQIDYLNAAALQHNQMTLADLGKGLCEVLPHRQMGLFEAYCRVVETGEPLAKEDLIYADRFGAQYLTHAYDIRASKLGDGFVASWRDVTARKQAELRLHEANQQIMTVWESMTDAFALLDREWRIVYVNQAAIQVFRQLTNLEPEAFLGKTHWEIFPWTVGQIIEQKYRRAMAEQVAVHFELLYEPSGGWFEIHAYPSCEGLGIYFRDISAAKQLEESRRKAEQDRDRFFNISKDMLAIADFEGYFVRLNPAWETTLGFTTAELLAQPCFDFVHPGDVAATIAANQGLREGEAALNFENRYRCKDGSYRWFAWNAIPDMTQKITYAIARDITEQKQTQEIICQQLAQIEAIYATAPIGLCFLDPERRFVQLNDRLAEINGLTVAQHLGRTMRELLPELAEIQEPIFQQVLQTGEPVLDTEVHGTTPAQPGVERFWLVSYYPLITAAGQPLGINIMVQEITERKRAEAERNQLLTETQAARESAEAANRSKDEFVALVAHELRSPLNAIMGWAKLLQTHQLDPATTDKALKTIARNTQAQVQLVEDLLDVSRIVCGTLQLTLESVNLLEVIEAALETVRPIAAAKQIQLSTQSAVLQPAFVWGDFNRLQQVFLNLLTNALKFTPNGGRVEVKLEQVKELNREAVKQESSEAHEPSTSSPRYGRITITDTGKGISPTFLPFVFDRFRQDEQNASAKEGLGLGLAIVKHLVEMHGGTITAESEGEGQGSSFTVMLLLEEDKAMQNDPADFPQVSQLDSLTLKDIRVLLVDDEPDMLYLTTFFLEEYGAIVQTANSAESALAQVPQFKPDLLVSDIAMPGQDGYDLLRHMRSIHPEGQVPAIALTAYASYSRQEDAFQVGFQEYLTKPVEPEQLVNAILNVIGQES